MMTFVFLFLKDLRVKMSGFRDKVLNDLIGLIY